MTSTLEIRIVRKQPAPAPQYNGWRVLHDIERGALWRSGVPEVYPLTDRNVTFGRDLQLLTYALNSTANPLVASDMTGDKYRILAKCSTAFTNGADYGYGCGIIHPDYVNQRDLNAPAPLRQDKVRTCGGQFVTGVVEGNQLHLRLGIDIMDANNPVSLTECLKNNWYLECTTVRGDGSIGQFPQGTNGSRVFWPFVSVEDVYIPLSDLQRWQGDRLPDAYKVYL